MTAVPTREQVEVPLPPTYRVDGATASTYLCFRVTRPEPDRVPLLHLIPDAEQQHPFDVVLVFADDPRVRVAEESP